MYHTLSFAVFLLVAFMRIIHVIYCIESTSIVQGSATSKMWLKVALLKLSVVLRHGASSAPAVDSESDV